MSKKLAEGLNGLVLDVKTGSGAFLPDEAQALELARTMIGLGEAHGCRTVALLTAMDRPLGRASGNALEVEESIAGLTGEGPADLMEVTYALGVEMLLTAGLARDAADARAQLERSITSGRAREKFGELIEAQGGNPGDSGRPRRTSAGRRDRDLRRFARGDRAPHRAAPHRPRHHRARGRPPEGGRRRGPGGRLRHHRAPGRCRASRGTDRVDSRPKR